MDTNPLLTMPNLMSDVSLRSAHTLALHTLCPVSKNPQIGSTITISYTPGMYFLEVYSLAAYLKRFRGGYRDVDGTIIVRDMEQTIQKIAADCAAVLDVAVSVEANLVLDTQQLTLSVVAS